MRLPDTPAQLSHACLTRQVCLLQGPFIACNVRLSPGSLQRMVHSVGSALRKWALRHDKAMPARLT